MKSIRILFLLLSFALPTLHATQPFTITLPGDFAGPESISRGPMQSFAYTRQSSELGVKALFQVSVVSIPSEGRGDSLEKMLAGMLRGVERRRTEFRKTVPVKSTLDSTESLSVDWEGVGEGHAMKGRMVCAVSDGRLFCIHFQDVAAAWKASLADVEEALQTFKFSK